jgi:PAS domain S-box-containing protein
VEKAKILIIEDELIVAHDLADMLGQWGYEVVGMASSGQEAVEKAQATTPNLVLADIKLEGPMDGIEASELIKATSETAIVYLTARTDSDLFDRAKETQPYGYLTKPVSPLELLRTVEMALYKHEMEQRLKDSEARFRAIFDLTFQFIGLMTTEGVLIEANKAALDLYGLSESDVIGFPFWETPWWTHSPDQQERLREAIKKAAAGEFVRFEAFHPTPDGELHCVDVSIKPVKDDQGNVSLLIPEGRDITDRRRTEEALRLSEERYRKIFENIQDVYFETLLTGIIVEISPSIGRISGYEPDDLIGTSVFDIYADPKQRNEVTKIVLEHGSVNDHELLLKDKDGTSIPCSITSRLVLDDEGRPYKFSGTLRDISDRKRTEQALLESEERFRNLSQLAEEGIAIHDDGVIVDANDGFARMSGYELHEIIGRHAREFTTPESWETIAKNMAGRNEKPYEAVGLRKDGSTFLCLVKGRRIRYGDRECRLATFSDITDLKNARERVEGLNRLKENLLSADGLEEKLKLITEGVVEIFGADFARIWITRPGDRCDSSCVHAEVVEGPHECRYRDRCLHLAASSGRYTHIDGSIHRRVPFDCYKIGRVASGKIPQFLTNNVQEDPNIHHPEWAKKLGLVSFAGYRLLSSGMEPVGVLGLFSKRPLFQEEDTLLKGLANTTAQVIQTGVAEEALRESEDRYRQLTQNSLTGIYIHQDDEFVYANQRLAEILGYSPEEILGKKYWAFLHTDDVETIKLAGHARTHNKSTPSHYEFRVICRNGEVKCLEAFITTIDYRGRLATMGNVADISERKQTEENRLAQLRFLEHMDRIERSIADAEILEDTMESVLATSLSIFDSDRAWLMYPCDPEASVCKVLVEITRPEYPGAFELGRDIQVTAQLADDFKTALTNKGPLIHHPEQGLPLPDAAVEYSVKSSMNSVLFPKIGKPWLCGLSQCSHARIWTEEDQRLFQEVGNRISEVLNTLLLMQNLRQSEERYRTLFEESTDAILIVKPEGEVIAANPSCEQIFGFSRDDLVGSDVIELYCNHRDRQKFRSGLERNGYVRDFEWRVRRKDGSERVCLLSSAAWKDEHGATMAHFSIVRDVTDVRRLERKLRHSQKMEAVGTLAGGIAHDVNNLLQVMLGQADMLLRRGALDEKSTRSVGAIRQSALNGADLVRRILAFSRETEAEMTPVNLSEEVLRIQRLLQRTISRMINIEMNLEDGLWLISADPSQLEQVILNLAVNAKDAMPDGGRLVFETRNETLREEYSRLHPEVKPGKYVLMTVHDSGQGIDKETLDRIFEPFFTTKQPGEGTGLGLSMVFGMVKSHGGHISCYSEVGVGTTFRIYFPVAELDLPTAVADTMEMAAGGTETLLLVDDEEPVRTLGAEMLELAGYTVLTAASGREALETYGQHKNEISLVILDLVMPEMGGKRCLGELLGIDPEAKVLIASGFSAEGPTKNALESGATGFIGKPFDLKRILLAVRKSLDSSTEKS